MKLPKQPLASVRELASRQAIRQFASKFELTYLGHVDPHHDEYQIIEGVTVSGSHRDAHYVVGNFRGHDIILAERLAILQYPGHTPRGYRWLLMQIDLRCDSLPHIFVDANHHEAVFYATMFVRFPQLEQVTSRLAGPGSLFLHRFKVFAALQQLSTIQQVLTPDIQAMLAHHFAGFDYEIAGDHVIIYVTNHTPSVQILQEMLRVGTWLADQLNKQAA
jgi:hypothetical protein